MKIRQVVVVLLLAGLAGAPLFAPVSPPGVVNYQGVLRDINDIPINAGVTMVFRFYDDAAKTTLLLTDDHGTVTVTGGLFNVELGGGTITAGAVNTLPEAFRDHGTVHVELEIGGETLSPLVEV